ncbi:MAG: Gfo/Idh/MocA family oxidoreductase [Lentisphaerae bacterium]|nr:Gfo/Idh/MocA family oxidoreductase [Lentisphaerota bacterium]
MKNRRLRMGMVGGAVGAFIGPVHRMAATLDGEAELVAGAFSSNPAKSRKTGGELMLDPRRTYDSYREMIAKESKLPPGERVDFVSIVTPNASHFDIASAFLKAGFNVVCDKPMTTSLKQAKDLHRLVRKTGKVFALTHNYTGYPMVKQARHMCGKGMLGKINKVVVEYPQGWMAGFITNPGNAIGMWRMDPKIAGGSCCIGDIGIHAENLVRYITGLEVEELCADLSTFVKINKLEDDGNILIHYKGGARGILYASQISAGEENPLSIRVYGTKLGLEWRQEDPNYLHVKDPAGYRTRYSKGNDYLCPEAKGAARLIWGHPDGFIEAFANIYREAYRGIRAEIAGKRMPVCDHPTSLDGVVGLAFIETVLASGRSRSKWTRMKS